MPSTDTEAAETLSGTSLSDTIEGKGGNDTINAGEGNDVIKGGEGIDSIKGGLGDDQFYYGSKSDFYDIIYRLRYSDFRSVNFLIKPHPAEDVTKYSALKKYSHVEVLQSDSNILYKVLPTSDIVIGFYSTALVEAKLINKKCIIDYSR